MSLYQTPTAHSDSIPRPACPWCGTQMMLARIEPDKPDKPDKPEHEQRTFECFRCHKSETVVVKAG